MPTIQRWEPKNSSAYAHLKETSLHQLTSDNLLNVDTSWPMAYLGLPQAVISARINSDWLFRPKLKNLPGAKNYAWCHFGQIHPQDISKMKSLKKKSGTGSFARLTPNYAWITPSFAWVFFSRKNGKMQKAVSFSSRLKVSPESGISPAGFVWSL